MGIAGKFDTVDFDGDIVDDSPPVRKGYLEALGGSGLGMSLIEGKRRRYLT
jgi:hypothetical protein